MKKLDCLRRIIFLMMIFSAICIYQLPALTIQAESASPVLFHVSQAETLPNDTAVIQGQYLNGVTKIEVCKLTDADVANKIPQYVPRPKEDKILDAGGTDRKVEGIAENDIAEVEILQKNTNSLKFIIPKTFQKGVYSVRLTDTNGNKQYIYLNSPIVNWVISEEGKRATRGDYLRIQGRNLNREGGTGQAVLIAEDGSIAARCPVTKAFDDYSVSVDIPESVEAGRYRMYYHNGLGGETAWSDPFEVDVVSKSEIWWAKTYNVTDYGAVGDGNKNCTEAFRNALHDAQLNGGGTVYVPRGRYRLTGQIDMPPYTVLQGESKDITQLVWVPTDWAIDELPDSLIYGSHHFAVKDLNIWATRAKGVIIADTKGERGNITLENLVVRQNPVMNSTITQSLDLKDIIEREHRKVWSVSGIKIGGDNIKVRNCDFNNDGMYSFTEASGFIQNTQFRKDCVGYTDNTGYFVTVSDGLIFEDCLASKGGADGKNMYRARVNVPYGYPQDREIFTLDGGGGHYAGYMANINGTHLDFGESANLINGKTAVGKGVFILSGTGQGQFREITAFNKTTVEIDTPFAVNPDATSYITLGEIRNNLHIINSYNTDCGMMQWYGLSVNGVFDGNVMERAYGLCHWARKVYNGIQPNWYCDTVNNEIREGLYVHWFGDEGYVRSKISILGEFADINVGSLVRRNKLSDYGYLQLRSTAVGGLTDCVIEDNTVTEAQYGLYIEGSSNGIKNLLLHNNHLINSESTYYINGVASDDPEAVRSAIGALVISEDVQKKENK